MCLSFWTQGTSASVTQTHSPWPHGADKVGQLWFLIMQCGLLFETVVVVLLFLPCLSWSITLWFLRHRVCQQMLVHKSERFASLTLLNYCLKFWADQGYIGGRPRTFHWVSSFHWAVNPPIEPLSEWHLSIRFHDIFADLDLSTSYYSPCIGESARPMGMLDRWVCGRLILWMSGLHREVRAIQWP